MDCAVVFRGGEMEVREFRRVKKGEAVLVAGAKTERRGFSFIRRLCRK
jgi:hypothetical protein